MLWIQSGILLAVAAIATILLTPLAKKIAIKLDAIDYPDARRVNKKPIPRMGGLAMYGAIILSCAVLYAGHEFFGWVDPFTSFLGFHINYWLLFLGITCMFFVGAIDDVRGLSAKTKLLGQIVSACIIAASGLLLSNVQNPFVRNEFIQFGWFAYPITVFYLVAFANIINLIDGLDGLASGIGAISAATIFTFSTLASRLDAAVLSVIIVGICVGFLRYNHHPASIFMGDSGSLLIGVCLGVVSLLAVARSTLVISLLVPIMAAGVPIVDTAMAIIRRLRAHQSVIEPDSGHIHHRLLKAGFSQGKTVAIMCLWTAALSVCSIILAESGGMWRVVAIVIAAAITGFAIAKLKLLEPVLRHHYNPRKKPPKE